MNPTLQTIAAGAIVALAAAWWLKHLFGGKSGGASCGGCEGGRAARKLAHKKLGLH